MKKELQQLSQDLADKTGKSWYYCEIRIDGKAYGIVREKPDPKSSVIVPYHPYSTEYRK